MKVFVGYGYNEQDSWVKQLVIPLIETLGCVVVVGEEMQGEDLSDGVIERISDSDACIGILTRRGEKKNTDGTYPTHRWVIEELATALAKEKAIFEIRETGIDGQKGIGGSKQRYEYKKTAEVLLQVAKFIMKEKRKVSGRIFMLIPPEIIAEIRPLLSSGDIECEYRFMVKTRTTEYAKTAVERFGGGLGVVIKNIPDDDASIEIVIRGPQRLTWSSGFVSVGSINVHIQKD
jgi:hypothetical protein